MLARVWQVFRIPISSVTILFSILAILWLMPQLPNSTMPPDAVVLSHDFATNTPDASPTTSPTATWTVQPSPTNTPRPTITRFIQPSPTNTLRPTATRFIQPSPTNTLRPTATRFIQPSPTNTLRPTATRFIQPSPTNTPRPTAVTPINATVNTDRLNIRRGPGPEYEVVTTVSRSNRLSLVGRNLDGTWVQINTSDARWVNASLLQINGNLLSLPVTYHEIGEWGPAGQATGARARALTVLRLRGCPGEDCRQLENPDALEEGDTVDIVGRSADGMWYQVNINGRSAWIRSDPEYVEVRGNRNATIPITDGNN